MTVGRIIPFLCALLLVCVPAQAGDLEMVDADGDAVVRRTDQGNDGSINPLAVLPDLASVTIEGWKPVDPLADPYVGSPDPAESPDIFRIEVRFNGLVNPPGTIGLGGHPFDPCKFGPSPVYGFLELDIDREKDTGGELTPVALSRYMANVGRFGGVPAGSIEERIVRRPGETDTNFFSEPQFERSGADFAFTLCGCWSVSIVEEGGDLDGQFDAGECWIVSGRFFERAQAFKCLSGVFGGSDFGLYDPVINARFSHLPGPDQTVIEVVFPMTPYGAGALLGEPVLDMDFDVANQFSLAEALNDVIIGAAFPPGATCRELGEGWDGRDYTEFLDPGDWSATALFGTSYSDQEGSALYVWTDTGFGEARGDFDGDQRAGSSDLSEMLDEIADSDGTSKDADGVLDGQVGVIDFSAQFSLYDLDTDGVVGPLDIALMPCNDADLALPRGIHDFTDVLAFATAFGNNAPAADLAAPFNVIDFTDLIAFLTAFGDGCP